MKFDEAPDKAEVFLRRAHNARERAHPRAPGLHASDLIFCLRQAWFKNAGAVRYPKPAPTLKSLTMWITGSGYHGILEGVSTEPGVLTEQARQVQVKQGKVSITMTVTPDLIETIPEQEVVEIKSTRKSSAATWKELDYYVEQLAWYCAVWGIPRGVLYVLYLMGDYKAERTSVFKAYEIEFSPDELRAWSQEMGLRARIATLNPEMPQPWRYAWECNYCEYASARGGPCDWDARSKGKDGDKSYIKASGFFTREGDGDGSGE